MTENLLADHTRAFYKSEDLILYVCRCFHLFKIGITTRGIKSRMRAHGPLWEVILTEKTERARDIEKEAIASLSPYRVGTHKEFFVGSDEVIEYMGSLGVPVEELRKARYYRECVFKHNNRTKSIFLRTQDPYWRIYRSLTNISELIFAWKCLGSSLESFLVRLTGIDFSDESSALFVADLCEFNIRCWTTCLKEQLLEIDRMGHITLAPDSFFKDSSNEYQIHERVLSLLEFFSEKWIADKQIGFPGSALVPEGYIGLVE